MTDVTGVREPTRIVFGTDGWRARVADEFTFDNVRRCADGVAHEVTSRGAAAKGVVVAYDRRFAVRALRDVCRRGPPRPRHPGVVRGASRADADELVRGGRARRGRGDRDHGQPQPVDRQRVQGQGAHGCRSRPGAARGDRGAPGGQRRSAGRAPAVRGRGDGRGRQTVRPVRRLRAVRSSDIDLDVLKAADVSVSSSPTVRGRRAGSPAARWRWRITVTEIHGATRTSAGDTEPIRPNIDAALATIAARRVRRRALLDGDADRAGAADERGSSFTSSRSTGLLMYYLAEHRGLREPVVVR